MVCLSSMMTTHGANYAIVSPPLEQRNRLLIRQTADSRLFVGQDVASATPQSQNHWLDQLLGTGYADIAANDSVNFRDTLIRAVQRLLSHDNLVSIHATVGLQDYSQAWVKPVIVWDFCSAGTLSSLLKHPSQSVGARRVRSSYLPESLCWHVARSVLCAVAWLHDGYRRSEAEGNATSADPDWMPVLHRAVQPENIFFEHPRRGETYGRCKLGNYSRCFVSGHMDGLSARQSMALPPPGMISALGEPPYQYGPDIADVGDLLTRATDLVDLGEVLYEMMTGERWMTEADKENRLQRRVHHQRQQYLLEAEVNDDATGAIRSYTYQLKRLVLDLLKLRDNGVFPTKTGAAASLLQQAERGFQEWRQGTPEGRSYVDAADTI